MTNEKIKLIYSGPHPRVKVHGYGTFYKDPKAGSNTGEFPPSIAAQMLATGWWKKPKVERAAPPAPRPKGGD